MRTPLACSLVLLLAALPLAASTAAYAAESAPSPAPDEEESPLAPTAAPAADGFSHFKKGDLSVSAFLGLNLLIPTAGRANAIFAIMGDGDYHLTNRLSVGATLGLGFSDRLFRFDFGPQAKFAVFATGPHYAYARGALTLDILRFFGGGMGFTAPGVNLQLGGGYKYFLTDRLSLGADLALLPSLYFFGGNTSFIFGINVMAGAEIKI
ncbi:MAG TPA: hypothetical protein VG389_03275 [Myxococcota bacterium]|nr:hypothetical protein [Myxococcota bacterium]